MLITFSALLAIALYLVAAIALARPLLTTGKPLTRVAMGMTLVAVLAHAVVLWGMHRGALDLHFFAALSLVAWVVSALTLLVNMSRPVAGLGVISDTGIVPFVALQVLHPIHTAVSVTCTWGTSGKGAA